MVMVSSKVDFVPFCHSVLDTESSELSYLWIPAFAGMTVFGLLTSSSMVINKFDIIRMAILPVEAYPPLIVDPDAPLAFSLAKQLFQPVSRWYAKKFQGCRAVDLGQFAKGCPLYVLRQSGCKCALKDLLRILVAKSLDHGKLVA
jgi:hypothetical protein